MTRREIHFDDGDPLWIDLYSMLANEDARWLERPIRGERIGSPVSEPESAKEDDRKPAASTRRTLRLKDDDLGKSLDVDLDVECV